MGTESTQREYQHDGLKMYFKNLCILVPRMKNTLAFEGFKMGLSHTRLTMLLGTFLHRVNFTPSQVDPLALDALYTFWHMVDFTSIAVDPLALDALHTF